MDKGLVYFVFYILLALIISESFDISFWVVIFPFTKLLTFFLDDEELKSMHPAGAILIPVLSAFSAFAIPLFLQYLQKRYDEYMRVPCLQVYGDSEKDVNEFMWRMLCNRFNKGDTPYPNTYEVMHVKDVSFALCTHGSKKDANVVVTRKAGDRKDDAETIFMHPEYEDPKDWLRFTRFVLSLK